MTKHAGQRFKLHITGPNTDQFVEITSGILVVGRKSGVDIHLRDDMVSREHAKIEKVDAACTVTDLNSSNGTKVNGDWLGPGQARQLADGDVIDIEPFRMVLAVTAADLEAAPATTDLAQDKEPEAPAAVEPEPAPPALESEPAPQPKITPALPRRAVRKKATTVVATQTGQPAPPPPPNDKSKTGGLEADYSPPPGLGFTHSHYLQFLPDIYHTDFMARFLALFESIYRPIEWTVDNFDQFLDPQTAPEGFLPWLANWFDLLLDDSWHTAQKRQLLREAYRLYAQRGTKRAISRILEIYTGQTPEIDDLDDTLAPFTFVVRLPAASGAQKTQIEALLNAHKPAYTGYALYFD